MQLAVFLVEDNAEIRENLTGALEELSCVKVVGFAVNEGDAMAWISRHPHGWDMVLADLFLESGNGMRLLERVQRARPAQKLIVFSNYVNAGVRKRCAQIGVDAVFDKSTEVDALVDYCAYQCTQLGPYAALASQTAATGDFP